MKNKKWILVLIVILPSLMWLILETSTINSRKLPIYGKKTLIAKGDTGFQEVNTGFYTSGDTESTSDIQKLNPDSFGIFSLIFLNDNYRKDNYRIAGITEFLNYKKSKISNLPIVIVTPAINGVSAIYNELKELNKHGNVHFFSWKKNSFDSLRKTYFINKPYYIDSSFVILIDEYRHIRGYYDSRYASEVKRLIGEYQHLRLKEEKQKLIQTNEIKSK